MTDAASLTKLCMKVYANGLSCAIVLTSLGVCFGIAAGEVPLRQRRKRADTGASGALMESAKKAVGANGNES